MYRVKIACLTAIFYMIYSIYFTDVDASLCYHAYDLTVSTSLSILLFEWTRLNGDRLCLLRTCTSLSSPAYCVYTTFFITSCYARLIIARIEAIKEIYTIHKCVSSLRIIIIAVLKSL